MRSIFLFITQLCFTFQPRFRCRAIACKARLIADLIADSPFSCQELLLFAVSFPRFRFSFAAAHVLSRVARSGSAAACPILWSFGFRFASMSCVFPSFIASLLLLYFLLVAVSWSVCGFIPSFLSLDPCLPRIPQICACLHVRMYTHPILGFPYNTSREEAIRT